MTVVPRYWEHLTHCLHLCKWPFCRTALFCLVTGPHKIDVTYEGLHVPKSPFDVAVVPGCDPSRVRAYGPGAWVIIGVLCPLPLMHLTLRFREDPELEVSADKMHATGYTVWWFEQSYSLWAIPVCSECLGPPPPPPKVQQWLQVPDSTLFYVTAAVL